MTMWQMATRLLPGWVVDPGGSFSHPVECTVDVDHMRGRRDWAVSACLEPPRPQRRLLDRADAVKVAGTGSFLLRAPVIEALRAARLTGWTAVPAPITLRDGSLRDDMLELRVTNPAGLDRPIPGFSAGPLCPGCGLREIGPGLRLDLAAQALDPRDGDFQSLWPIPATAFVSERARAVLAGFEIETIEFLQVARARLNVPGHANTPPPHWPAEAQARIAGFWR